jgi:hypothetical protein
LKVGIDLFGQNLAQNRILEEIVRKRNKGCRWGRGRKATGWNRGKFISG